MGHLPGLEMGLWPMLASRSQGLSSVQSADRGSSQKRRSSSIGSSFTTQIGTKRIDESLKCSQEKMLQITDSWKGTCEAATILKKYVSGHTQASQKGAYDLPCVIHSQMDSVGLSHFCKLLLCFGPLLFVQRICQAGFR